MSFQYSSSKYGDEGNYIEITLQDDIEEENNIHIDDKVFFRVLNNFKKRYPSSFQKHYKEYVFCNLFYENNEKNQIKIYRKQVMKYEKPISKLHITVYHKEKQAYHIFPCSTNLHSISYISKVIFKLNHRVFVNFEKKTYEKNQGTYNKIYLNYNHEANVDTNHIDSSISSAVNFLLEQL